METIEQWIIQQYQNDKSAYEIVEELNKNSLGVKWYPNKVLRLLRKAGVAVKTKAEAQSNTLKRKRSPHPTEGTKRSVATKLKISERVSNTYRSDPANREKRQADSKQRWEDMTPSEKENLRSKAAKAVRASAQHGSYVERFLMTELRKMGYSPIAHSKSIIPSQALELDLFVPELNLVIEVDGLSHSQDIWGAEAYAKTKASDAEKNGLVLTWYNMIRIEANAKKFTQAYGRRVWERLKPRIEYIKEKGGIKLQSEDRFFYIPENI